MNSARKTKLKLKQHKPLNPLVVPLMHRKAGSHRKSNKTLRLKDKREVRQDLRELAP